MTVHTLAHTSLLIFFQVSLLLTSCPPSPTQSPTFTSLSRSLSFFVSFSLHQAVQRQIRSWFTIQLNGVIETLLQISLSFSPCANWPSSCIYVCACTCVSVCVLSVFCCDGSPPWTEGHFKFKVICACGSFGSYSAFLQHILFLADDSAVQKRQFMNFEKSSKLQWWIFSITLHQKITCVRG